MSKTAVLGAKSEKSTMTEAKGKPGLGRFQITTDSARIIYNVTCRLMVKVFPPGIFLLCNSNRYFPLKVLLIIVNTKGG